MKNNSVFLNYIKKNRVTFIILIFFLVVGLVIGISFINNSTEDQKNEINEYVNQAVQNIKNSEGINRTFLLFQSLKNNTLLVLLIWFLGCTFFGSILVCLVIGYKGFSLGYTFSAFIACLGIKNGTIFSVLSLIFQNVIIIPTTILLAQSGIKLFQNLKKNRYVNIRNELIRHSILMLICETFMCVASIFEVYISTNLLIFFKNFL